MPHLPAAEASACLPDTPLETSEAEALPYVPNSVLGALAAFGAMPPLESATEHLRSALRDAIAGAMGDIYHCGRVWSAWSHGTMRENDFSLAAEDDDILANITDAVLAVYASNTALPGLRQVGGVQTGEIKPMFHDPRPRHLAYAPPLPAPVDVPLAPLTAAADADGIDAARWRVAASMYVGFDFDYRSADGNEPISALILQLPDGIGAGAHLSMSVDEVRAALSKQPRLLVAHAADAAQPFPHAWSWERRVEVASRFLDQYSTGDGSALIGGYATHRIALQLAALIGQWQAAAAVNCLARVPPPAVPMHETAP